VLACAIAVRKKPLALTKDALACGNSMPVSTINVASFALLFDLLNVKVLKCLLVLLPYAKKL